MSKLEKAIEALKANPNITSKGLVRATGATKSSVYNLRRRALQAITEGRPTAVALRDEKPIQKQSKNIEMVKNGDYILVKIPVNELSQLLLASLLKQAGSNVN